MPEQASPGQRLLAAGARAPLRAKAMARRIVWAVLVLVALIVGGTGGCQAPTRADRSAQGASIEAAHAPGAR